MILYHCMTIWQLLSCIVHKINYKTSSDAVLIYPDYLLRRGANFKKLTSVFLNVYCYPSQKLLSSYEKNHIITVGNKLFKRICGYEIRGFEEIYVAGVQVPFSMYLALSSIHFNYMEEANEFYWYHEKWMESIRKRLYSLYEILDELKIENGTSEYIDKIYAAIPQGEKCSNDKVIPFYVNNELKKIGKTEMECIYDIFL